MTFRILAISGSLRAGSSNTALINSLSRIAPPGVQVVIYEGLGSLPYFKPDLEDSGLPASVAELRAQVQAAAAIVISSPEYAHGVPGVLKNALDWLVAGIELPGKPVALLNASPRATHAQASLKETLTTMSAVVVPEASIGVPLLGRDLDADRIASDPELRSVLQAAIAALRAAGRD